MGNLLEKPGVEVWTEERLPLSVFDMPLPNIADDMLPVQHRYREMLSGLGLLAVLILSMAAFGGSVWKSNQTYPHMVAFFDRLR